MSLKPLLSFASGELDPILTDNVTLEKFNKGVATGRNTMIGKTGALLSRFSRYHSVNAKNAGEPIKIYYPPNSDGYVLEFGIGYVRIHTYTESDHSLSLNVERVTTYTEDDLPKLHFTTSQGYVYIFCDGKKMKKLQLNFGGSDFMLDADVFKVANPLLPIAITPAGSPAGYTVDYLCTLVINGEETLSVDTTAVYTLGLPKPIANGQTQSIAVSWPTASVDIAQVSEVRVYSRPHNGGAYGYLGSTTSFVTSGANKVATFVDIGGVPDYSNGTQDLLTKYGLGGLAVIDLNPKTGTVYQQRLITTTDSDKEALVASRPGFKNNFYRDFPYAADSALLFKAGTSGKAYVLRVIESEGLVVFTTNGVYTNSGLLGINNLALEKRGAWIINVDIPPLVVPGGLFFVDTSNTIRQMIFSQEILAYESIEATIFSNHLFKRRKIKSWCYQTGSVPLIIVTFSDGTFATFTYNYEQQMKAWMRHDSKYPLEQVEGTDKYDRSFYVINKNGNRSIEVSLPRIISAEDIVNDPEADMSAPTAFMDSIKSFRSFVDFAAIGDFLFTPEVAGEWDGVLILTGSGGFTLSWVGSIIRWFDPIDHSAIDFEVTAYVNSTTIKVQPSVEFPSAYATNPRLYKTLNGLSGLSHLEGEKVSVVVDGALVTSPYNDVEVYPDVIVTGGAITLPDDMRGAFIHVGRPICADVKTLNVSTVEQAPTLIESVNVNKMYVRVQDTRGLYVANRFPEEAQDKKDGTTVVGMDSLDEALVPKDSDLIGNRYFPPVSKRCEVTVRGDWSNNGQISLRQVDPYHFEILSIIPDLTVLTRSDR